MQYYILCVSLCLLKRKKKQEQVPQEKHSQDVLWVCCVTGQRAATVGESEGGVGSKPQWPDGTTDWFKKATASAKPYGAKTLLNNFSVVFFTWWWAALEVGMWPLEHRHLTPLRVSTVSRVLRALIVLKVRSTVLRDERWWVVSSHAD